MRNAIIFDLGGVIERINPKQVAQEFRALGMSDPSQFFSLYGQSDICSDFETGKIQESQFVDHLKTVCSPGISSETVIQAWCTNLCGVPAETITVLKTLRENGFRLFVLSNTNPIHAREIETRFNKVHDINFHSMFEKVYYSFEVGLRKPDDAIYQHVLNDAKLNPELCVYIDDLEVNLKSPERLGLRCVHHQTNASIDNLHAWSTHE
ncbi:MAG TPA: HAD family phosphatase [Coxiellaceae bacterium]|nr:MAG: hypothetical protein A3E81_03190 [Gammaproteobacteria bacterium RIFCSPHIGHO2_12_FULL_36_30]HLB56392.1 HAD family phosphatase [Coxiellaceae bacterium]